MSRQFAGAIGCACCIAFSAAITAGSDRVDASELAAIQGGAICEKPSALANSGCQECEAYGIGWYRKCVNNPTGNACVPASAEGGIRPMCHELQPECGGLRMVFTNNQCTGDPISYDTCEKNYADAVVGSGSPGTCP